MSDGKIEVLRYRSLAPHEFSAEVVFQRKA